MKPSLRLWLRVFFLQHVLGSFVRATNSSTRLDDLFPSDSFSLATCGVLVSSAIGCRHSDATKSSEMCHWEFHLHCGISMLGRPLAFCFSIGIAVLRSCAFDAPTSHRDVRHDRCWNLSTHVIDHEHFRPIPAIDPPACN
jgi:hypothetical protein